MNQPRDLPASEIDRIMALMAAGQPATPTVPVGPAAPPLDAAMQMITGAPSGPVFQPPQTLSPITVAMGKPSNGQPPVGAPTPDTNPDEPKDNLRRPGFFGRIRQRPGGSDALIALGANLLSAPNIFEGLSRGALAYQQTLRDAEERARPQSELVEDGAFVSRYNPVTGERSFERTPVADWTDTRDTRRLETQRLIAADRNQTTLEVTDRRIDSEQSLAQMRIEAERLEQETRMSHDERMAELSARLERENDGYRAGLELQALESGQSDPPPASVSRMIAEYTEAVDSTTQTLSRIDGMLGAIDRGELNLNLPNNLRHRTALLTGIGVNAETRRFAELQGLVRNMQNALLILNKGVQTDGDADRALAEIMQGGDETTVRQALAIARAEIERRMRTARQTVRDLSERYGARRAAPPAARGRTSGRTASGVSWRVVQ